MQSYYDIIGRPKKKPIKERLCFGLQMLLCCLWIIIAVGCAVYTLISTRSVMNGLLALAMTSFLGIVIFPVYAFVIKAPFAIAVCCVYIVLILTLIFLEITKGTPTKKEQIENLQLQMMGKEFELKYPRAVDLKNEYNQIRKSHKQSKESINAALKATSKDEINANFKTGVISKAEHNKLIEAYEICEFRTSQEKFLDEVEQEIEDHLKEELAHYIAEFEQQT